MNITGPSLRAMAQPVPQGWLTDVDNLSQAQGAGTAGETAQPRQGRDWNFGTVMHRVLHRLSRDNGGADPVTRQNRVLRRLVRHNRRTTFGLQHGFATVGNLGDYVHRVPVMDDTQLLDWLRYRSEHDPRALTLPRTWREAAAMPLAESPGDGRRARAEYDELRQLCPQAFRGALLLTHPADSACFGGSARLRTPVVLPAALWELKETDLRDLLILRLALGRPDVTCLAGPDSADLRHWMRLLETHHRHLLKDLRQGGFFLAERLPEALAQHLAPALAADPERARHLARLRTQTGTLRPADLWPRLALWLTPAAADLEDTIARDLPAGVRVSERVFESDPLRRAVARPARGGACLPLVDEHLYEFAERTAWDAGQRATLCTQQLREGHDYYLIISGEYGLYRYFTGDLLTVTGWRDGLPLFRFLPAPPSRAHIATAAAMPLRAAA